MTRASALVTLGIPSIALIVAALVVSGIALSGPREGRRRRLLLALAGAALWLGASGAAAASGALLRFDLRPPPLFLLLAVLLAAALALGLSPVGRRLSELPLAALVGAQAFRLPLELVMHRAATEGTMPPQMSFSGWNFDIATGISAAICGLLLARGELSRRAVVAWNLLGTLLLATIVAIAISSTPMIRAFGDDPALVNDWIAHFPFVWLPAVLVSAALLGHVVVARRLLRERDQPRG